MSALKAFAFSAFSLALLAGCAGPQALGLGDFVTKAEPKPGYLPLSVSVFAASGGYATIRGTTRDGASAEELAAQLRLPAFVSPREVRAAPPEDRPSGPHLAIVFAPKSGATPRRACRGEDIGGRAGETLKVLAAFCSSYGTPVTEALYTADGSPVPSDPDFARRIRFLTNAVMPPFNADFQGEGRRRRSR